MTELPTNNERAIERFVKNLEASLHQQYPGELARFTRGTTTTGSHQIRADFRDGHSFHITITRARS